MFLKSQVMFCIFKPLDVSVQRWGSYDPTPRRTVYVSTRGGRVTLHSKTLHILILQNQISCIVPLSETPRCFLSVRVVGTRATPSSMFLTGSLITHHRSDHNQIYWPTNETSPSNSPKTWASQEIKYVQVHLHCKNTTFDQIFTFDF